MLLLRTILAHLLQTQGQVSTFLFCREPFNTSLNVIPQPVEINLGNGEAIEAILEGKIRMIVKIGRRRVNFTEIKCFCNFSFACFSKFVLV